MDDNNQKKMSIACEVCAEQFSKEGRIPRILISCGHTFCECCLEKLKKRHVIAGITTCYKICCPKCKVETIVQSSKRYTTLKKLLPKNFSYLDLIEDVLDQSHQKETCEEHPDYVFDMFCHDEEEAVCLKCTVHGQHNTHQVSKLSDFSDQKRIAIEHDTSRLSDTIKVYRDLKAHLEERRSHIKIKVDEIRQDIITRFTFVQEKIKATLDAKLEQVMNELNEMHAVQSTILEGNLEIANKGIEELEELRENSNEFLSEASQRDIAKEKDLITNVEMCLDKVKNHELTMKHVYEVKIDDTRQMLNVMADMVGAWACEVHDSTELGSTVKTVDNIQETYLSTCFSKSLRVLFDEEQPSDGLGQNPFEGICCEYKPGTLGEEQPSELNENEEQPSKLNENEEQPSELNENEEQSCELEQDGEQASELEEDR